MLRGLVVQQHTTCSAAHRIDRVCIGPPEAEGGASFVAESPAGYLCRVRREAIAAADVAPEAPRKDLQAAILVAGACAAVNEAGCALQFCAMQNKLLSMSKYHRQVDTTRSNLNARMAKSCVSHGGVQTRVLNRRLCPQVEYDQTPSSCSSLHQAISACASNSQLRPWMMTARGARKLFSQWGEVQMGPPFLLIQHHTEYRNYCADHWHGPHRGWGHCSRRGARRRCGGTARRPCQAQSRGRPGVQAPGRGTESRREQWGQAKCSPHPRHPAFPLYTR